ncbi:uncharacterized protein VNE69_12040 [Vairimorpha necatrix]|uniref:Kinetochore protein Spc24 n=1 Tax=Vairimorpha necatrix TaxID=6039 RepID=A0AAX4JGB2_9MICR
MDSSDIHDILAKITDYDNLLDVHLLTSVIELNTISLKEHSSTLSSILNNTDLLEKKISNIENEINKIKLSHTKNNEKYKFVNNERLRLAKKYVDLENEFSKMKSEVDELDLTIKRSNEEMVSLNKPCFYQLYLELIKGFGIEISKEKRNICRIRSSKKKCIVEVDLEEMKNEAQYKITNKIWETM